MGCMADGSHFKGQSPPPPPPRPKSWRIIATGGPPNQTLTLRECESLAKRFGQGSSPIVSWGGFGSPVLSIIHNARLGNAHAGSSTRKRALAQDPTCSCALGAVVRSSKTDRPPTIQQRGPVELQEPNGQKPFCFLTWDLSCLLCDVLLACVGAIVSWGSDREKRRLNARGPLSGSGDIQRQRANSWR